MTPSATLVRYSEIGLKGGNRPQFERRLRENLRAALEGFPGTRVRSLRGRLMVHHGGGDRGIVEALRRIPGVKSISPALQVSADLESITAAARTAFGRARQSQPAARTFRVTTRRADKSFEFPSIEVDRVVGAALLEQADLRVDLVAPDIEVGIDVRPEGCFVFGERIPGPGGLPVGSTGRALGLLSGGIDSPVACYLAMKRGLQLTLVFFHSPEFTGHGAAEKVTRLARVLAASQPMTWLCIVPFGPVQVAIKTETDAAYRNLLYRRMMHRIAEPLAVEAKAQALVSGDALGQVASQTLENLAVTAQATKLPLLRPLLTYDKEETIELARDIGTFEISILREPDCCTLFQPRHPKVRGRVSEALANESRLDVEGLVGQALAGMQRVRVDRAGTLASPSSRP